MPNSIKMEINNKRKELDNILELTGATMKGNIWELINKIVELSVKEATKD